MSRGRTFLLSKDNGVTTANAAGGSANQVAYFDSAFQITGESAFTYNPSTNLLSVDSVTLISVGTGGQSATNPLSLSSSTTGAYETVLQNTNAGTGAHAVMRVRNANDNNASLDIAVLGTGFTTSGPNIQDAGKISANSNLSGGLTIGTVANADLQFFTNNTLRLLLKNDGTALRPIADDSLALGAGALGFKQVYAAYTDTSGGVTGNQTINKMAGSVNFAAGASTVVVTNSVVTTSSKVFAQISTSGSTGVIGSVVPAAGSFAIVMATNPAAETRVQWFVLSTN